MQIKKIDDIAGRKLKGEWRFGRPGSKERLVILCHGYQSSQKDSTLVVITKGLNDSGLDTFTFNFSPNTGGFDIEHQVEDVIQIVDHFKDYKEVILFAGSFGALTSAIATLHLPKVKRLITLNGFFGEGQLGPKYRGEYRKFRIASFVTPTYRRIWRYYKRELKPELIKVPVLVIYSKVDPDVLHVQSQKFYDGLKVAKKVVELESSDHGVTDAPGRKQIVSEIVNWLG